VPGNDAPHADGHEIAVTAARAAAAKQAANVTILDVHGLIVITDYFVIASGETDRQVKTIVEEVERAVRDLGEKPVRREGDTDSRWILLDYIDVVVHVFAREEREYYDLERLWRDAPRLGWNASEQAAAGSRD
jgi:ribosome-associated protein